MVTFVEVPAGHIDYIDFGYCVWCGEVVGFACLSGAHVWIHKGTREVLCGGLQGQLRNTCAAPGSVLY